MRALCASIITAGALIGLGLSALGVGTRYQNLMARDPSAITYIKWAQLDTPMMLIRMDPIRPPKAKPPRGKRRHRPLQGMRRPRQCGAVLAR